MYLRMTIATILVQNIEIGVVFSLYMYIGNTKALFWDLRIMYKITDS